MSASGTGGDEQQGFEDEEDDREEDDLAASARKKLRTLPSQALAQVRRRSSTETHIAAPGVSFIVFASLQEASEYLKISEESLQSYIEFAAANGGMLLSFRDKKNLQTITKRRNDTQDEFFNKPGPVKTKMNSTFPKGHIPRDRSLLTEGQGSYNYLDNSYSGAFPADSATSVECLQLRALLRAHEVKFHAADEIVEVRKIGSRICYSENVVQYQKSGSDYIPITNQEALVTKPKHYIQEVESLHSVLKNIARGVYKDVVIQPGIIEFRFGEKNLSIKITDLPVEVRPDLEKLEKLVAIAKLKITPMSYLANMKERAEMLNQMDSELFAVSKEIDDCECPIWYRKSVDDSPDLELPVMVMAGDNGFEIASDLDILQLPAPFGLPASMHALCITGKSSEELFVMFTQAIQDLTAAIANLKVDAPGRQNFIDLLAEVQATYNHYYVETSADELTRKLSVLGTTNIYGITKQFIFNRDNKLEHNTPWPHGADDLHPASAPENFGAVIMLQDGRTSYIGDEKTYVLYLLHNRDILLNPANELSIHPHWLTSKDPCNDYWKDIVYIQGLFAKKLDIDRGIAPPGKQYFDNLMTKSSLKSRGTEVITEATAIIESLRQKVATLEPKTIDSELEKMYNTCIKSEEDSRLLSGIQEKMKPNTGATMDISGSMS